MTQQEKQLLLKDLCARLQYGLKYNFGGNDGCDYTMDKISLIAVDDAFPIEDVKPYLRSMSSMTEEEKAFVYNGHIEFWVREDYCNKHHLDYCDLIEKGLALEAPDGMYKIE